MVILKEPQPTGNSEIAFVCADLADIAATKGMAQEVIAHK